MNAFVDFKKGFAPLCGDGASILVIGTMPGNISLNKHEYYGNPRNSFWRIMREVFNCPYEFNSYDEKRSFLLQKRIALWDVYQKAQREGSLDSNIKNGSVNNINKFIKENPSIKKVLFNGKEPHKVYKKHFNELADIEYYVLPSTSPTNTIKYEEKLSKWEQAIMNK